MKTCTLVLAALLATALSFSQQAPDPWQKSDLVQAAALAETMRSSARQPTILCVAFPVLYRSKHIAHAIFAGQGSTAEGIESLTKAVANLPKDSAVVLYCGCCPMVKCPNIRPAYQALKKLGFTHVRVLDIPTNMAADWYTKDYPSEAGGMMTPPASR